MKNSRMFLEVFRDLSAKTTGEYFDCERNRLTAIIDDLARMPHAEWERRHLPTLMRIAREVDEAHRPLEGAELRRAVIEEVERYEADVAMGVAA